MAIGSVIGAVVSLAAAGLTYAAQKESNQMQQQSRQEANQTNIQLARETNATSIDVANRNNETAIQLQREQNEFNRKQWEDTNAWNAPANQLKLWTDAGMNPLSFNGGTPTTPAQQSSLPSLSAPNLVNPTVSPTDPKSPLSGIGDILNQIVDKSAMLEKTKAETTKIKADTDKTVKETDWLDELNKGQLKQTYTEISYKEQITTQSKEETQKIQKSCELIDREISSIEQGIRESIERVAGMKLENQEKEFNVKTLQERYDLGIKQALATLNKTYSDISVNKATVSQIKSVIELMFEQTSLTKEQTNNAKVQGDILSKEVELGDLRIEFQRLLNGKVGVEIEGAKKANSAFYFDKALDCIKTLNNVVQTGAMLYVGKGLGSAKSAAPQNGYNFGNMPNSVNFSELSY